VHLHPIARAPPIPLATSKHSSSSWQANDIQANVSD
jgi:hypothetical protein